MDLVLVVNRVFAKVMVDQLLILECKGIALSWPHIPPLTRDRLICFGSSNIFWKLGKLVDGKQSSQTGYLVNENGSN